MSYTTQGGKSTTCQHVARAESETGPIQIQIVTVKEIDDWTIKMSKTRSRALIQ